jgi:hypothetical protein
MVDLTLPNSSNLTDGNILVSLTIPHLFNIVTNPALPSGNIDRLPNGKKGSVCIDGIVVTMELQFLHNCHTGDECCLIRAYRAYSS